MASTETPTLTALALTCSLTPSPAESSTDLLTQQLLDALAEHDVTGELVRVVDHDVRPGVEADMGDGDAWPALREKVLAADVLVMGPDCGTAHVGGVALGFANVVRPGTVGVVAASGTGAQQVMCLLDAAGVGLSHCLGVGGRDLLQRRRRVRG